MSGASRTACKPAGLLALLAILGALCTTAATGDGVATATAEGTSTRGGLATKDFPCTGYNLFKNTTYIHARTGSRPCANST